MTLNYFYMLHILNLTAFEEIKLVRYNSDGLNIKGGRTRLANGKRIVTMHKMTLRRLSSRQKVWPITTPIKIR